MMFFVNLIRKAVKAAKLLSSVVYVKGLSQGIAASIEHRSVIGSLGLDSCLDIGANKGQFSLLIRKLHPNCKIKAFEPLGLPAEKYQKYFFKDELTVLEIMGLGVSSFQAEMNVSNSTDSSSLLEIGKLQSSLFPGTDKAGVEIVRVERLDRVVVESDLLGVTLMKIDVQGYELQVLHGAEGVLPSVDYIYVEASFQSLYVDQPMADDVVRFLQSVNFKLIGIYNITYDSQGFAVQSDMLFLNKALQGNQ